MHGASMSHATTNGAPPPPRNSNAVQEYGVAWTSLLTAAAEKLEAGRLFWENTTLNNTDSHTARDVQLELLEIPRVQTYFAALGRIYYVASLVRLSAEMLGLLHFVQELELNWTRCTTVWNHTTTNTEIKPLSWVVSEAANKLGQSSILTEIESVDSSMVEVLHRLRLDEFPRMLAWSEGLDSVLLIPLSVIAGEHEGEEEGKKAMTAAAEVEWPLGSGRLCLSVVANFWVQCVSSIPPELE
jgi:hypothetical protein